MDTPEHVDTMHRRSVETRLDRALRRGCGDVTVLLDTALQVVWASASAHDVLGVDPEELIDRPVASLLASAEEREMLCSALSPRSATQVGGAAAVLRLRRGDGRTVEAEVRWSDMRSDPAVRGVLVVARDVSGVLAATRQGRRRTDQPADLTRLVGLASVAVASQQEAQTMRHAATVDALTGVLNRRGLGETLTRLADDPGVRSIAILFIDLDDFKSVNDRFGHAAGDRVLQEVAARLRSVVRPDDVVCRVGGDEFVVVLHDVADEPESRRVGRRVRAAVERDVPWAGEDIPVRISLGSSFRAQGEPLGAVVDDADLEMYGEKRRRPAS